MLGSGDMGDMDEPKRTEEFYALSGYTLSDSGETASLRIIKLEPVRPYYYEVTDSVYTPFSGVFK